jgi:hypothetical protein
VSGHRPLQHGRPTDILARVLSARSPGAARLPGDRSARPAPAGSSTQIPERQTDYPLNGMTGCLRLASSGSAPSVSGVDLGGLSGSEDSFKAAQTEVMGSSESSSGRSGQVRVDDDKDLRLAESVGQIPCLPGGWLAAGSLFQGRALDTKSQFGGLGTVRVSDKHLHCTSEGPFHDSERALYTSVQQLSTATVYSASRLLPSRLSASLVSFDVTSLYAFTVTAIWLCGRICITTRGCTSIASRSEAQVRRVV